MTSPIEMTKVYFFKDFEDPTEWHWCWWSDQLTDEQLNSGDFEVIEVPALWVEAMKGLQTQINEQQKIVFQNLTKWLEIAGRITDDNGVHVY